MVDDSSVQCPLRPAAQDTAALMRVWRSLDVHSCPYTYNFHMHSTCSDGQLEPEGMMEQALAIGLQGMAITDHHSVQGYKRAAAWLAQHQPNDQPWLWTGVEITSVLGNGAVHILGYAFDPSHKAIAPYLQGDSPKGKAAQAQAVIRAIHKAGGLAVLAHPARYRRSYRELIPLADQAGIDGVEAYYAYQKTIPWRPTPDKTAGVRKLGSELGLFQTCGTDSHGLDLLLRV